MIRAYKQNDEQGIQNLFKEVFHKDLTRKEWRWKYKENSLGQTIATIAEENNEVIGHVALIPVKAKWFGKEIIFGARTDTMVSPRFRGKGIYKQLNKNIIEQAENQQIDFLFGYPAIGAKKLLIRYTNAKEISFIPRLVFVNSLSQIVTNRFPLFSGVSKVVKPLEKLRLKKILNTEPSFPIKSIESCGPEFDILWREANPIANVLIKRDASYLNWRYHKHPKNKYQMYGLYENNSLLGYTVIFEEQKGEGKNAFLSGIIVDLFAINNENVWEALIIHSLQKLQHTDIVQTWAPSHTTYYQALKNVGFIEKDKPMPLVGNLIERTLPHVEKGFEIHNWYITPGDVDSF